MSNFHGNLVRQKFYLIFLYSRSVSCPPTSFHSKSRGTYKSAKIFFVHIHHNDFNKECQLENIAKHPKNLLND